MKRITTNQFSFSCISRKEPGETALSAMWHSDAWRDCTCVNRRNCAPPRWEARGEFPKSGFPGIIRLLLLPCCVVAMVNLMDHLIAFLFRDQPFFKQHLVVIQQIRFFDGLLFQTLIACLFFAAHGALHSPDFFIVWFFFLRFMRHQGLCSISRGDRLPFGERTLLSLSIYHQRLV